MSNKQSRIRSPNSGIEESDASSTQPHQESELSSYTNRTIPLSLSLTGNPWTDMGIVSLCQELDDGKPTFLVKNSMVWTEYEVTLSVYGDPESIEDMEAWLYDVMRRRWNELYWPNTKLKPLRLLPTFKDGFVDTSAQTRLTPEMKALIKEKLPKASTKDVERLAQNRLSYVGTPSNASKIQGELDAVVKNFIQTWIGSEGKKCCDICGRASDKLDTANQSINPLMNKYHNNQVRGFRRRNDYLQWCPTCCFTNLSTSLDANIPFVFDGSRKPDPQTLLILPDVPSLELLRRVRKMLRLNLRDLSLPSELYTSTNLRGYWWHDLYSLALAIFHNIFYEFSIREDTGEEGWSFEPVTDKKQDIALLTRWLILPFTKKQNVRFGNIHVVEVDDRLYDFIKPIPLDEGEPLKLVPDILSQMSPHSRHPDGINTIRRLSQAIATSDVSLFRTAMFQLWKHSDDINYYAKRGMLPRFAQHFLEVNAVLDTELREDLRALGIIIGSAFSRDVTLISKLYNVSNESAFRAVLNQFLFRLYKLSAAGKMTGDGKLEAQVHGERKTITRVSQERITRLLERLSSESWKEMAETLSIFASLSAFNANLSKSTE